ncbi:MAG: choice-of-anchor tandem repeat NxxGxxAF-containing protein [Lysobacterales bacterium]
MPYKLMLKHVLICSACLVGLTLVMPVIAGNLPQFTVDTVVLARSGQPSPDGNGVFGDQFTPPLLNNAGQTAFVARLLATASPDVIDDLGLYRASAIEVITMARGGDTSAANNLLNLQPLQLSSLARRQLMGIDGSGGVAFIATDSETMDAIYRSDGVALSTVLQAGQNTAFGDDLQVGPAALGFLVNNNGQLAYLLNSNTQNLLVRSDGLVTQPVFGSGQSLPGPNTLAAIRAFGLSNSGEVVARLNTSSDSFGPFVGDPGSVRLVNQTGAAAPDGLGSFVADPPRLPAAINSQSAVALVTAVDDITMDYLGLYVDQGAGLIEQTRTGNPTFGGTLLGLVSGLQLNDRGDLLYAMVSSDNTQIERLVLHRDGAERLVASLGDAVAPVVGGLINSFNGFTLNESGQVMISARVVIPGLPQATGLYLYDPIQGLVEVVRTGQAFAGGTLTVISAALPLFPLETNTLGNAQTGFNDAGQVAFAYALDNGEQGIALADVQFVLPDALFKDSFESIVP